MRLFDFLERVVSNASWKELVLVPFLTLLSSRDFSKERTKCSRQRLRDNVCVYSEELRDNVCVYSGVASIQEKF